MNLRRRTKLLLLPLGVLTALGGAGPLLGQTALVDKSLQVPDASFNGLDVRVTNYNILDNDFRCNAIGPITWTDHPLATSP